MVLAFLRQDIRFVLVKIKKILLVLKLHQKIWVYLKKEFDLIDFLNSFFNGAIIYFVFEKNLIKMKMLKWIEKLV